MPRTVPPARPDVPSGASPEPRNGLGAVTFVVVVLAALLAVVPATAAFGFLLCLLALVPAFVAHRRTRKGTATNRRRSVAALTMAPAFLVVAVAVGAATTPAQVTTAGEATALADTPAAAAPAPLLGAPASSATSTVLPAPESPAAGASTPTTQAARTAAASPRTSSRAAAVQAAAAPARTSTAVRGTDPAPVAQPAATKATAKTTKAPKTSTTELAPVEQKAADPVEDTPAASSCDTTTHYRNTDGDCVPRPNASSSVDGEQPTARCNDGEYSYSKSRSGTCSGHGGVDEWL